MTSGATWVGRLTRGLAGATIGALAGGLFAAPTAVAETTVQLKLVMSSLTTTGTKPSDKVTIKGTLTNAGKIPAYGVQGYLWRSIDPVRDQASLQSIATGSSSWGGRLTGPGRYLLFSEAATAFAPGTSRQFTLTATMEQLGFDTTTVAYAIGIDVVATADQSSNFNLAAQVRTFVPMPGKQPVPVTSVVLLSAAPTKLAANLFANEDLATELTGRLNTLLNAAGQSGNSWLIDPALLDEVRDLADGYFVVKRQGTEPGTGQKAAIEWLERFAKLDASRGGRTLFANPDTYGAQANGIENLLSWSGSASSEVAGISGLPLVVVPTARTIGKSGLEFLAPSGAVAVAAANSRTSAALQRADGSLPVLGVASNLATPPTSGGSTAAIKARQLCLAETVISGRNGKVRLLTSLEDLTQDASTRPSWVTQRSLDEVLEQTPTKKANLASAKPKHLSKAKFGELDRLDAAFAAYNELVAKSSITERAQAARLRLISAAWITDRAAGNAYADQLRALVGPAEISKRVRLEASRRFVMSARSTQFPVTVTNGLSEPIKVRVVVTTQNPQRLSVPPSEVVTIAPGQSETVNIRPEATGNGLIMASAYVTTAEGRRVSDNVSLTIEVTELGVVAWIIVGVSGVVLVGATAWRIRQVRRRDRRSASQTSASQTTAEKDAGVADES